MKDLVGSLLVMALVSTAAGAAGPELRLEKYRAVATELAPGGAVVFFSVSREPSSWMEQVVCRAAFVTDEDGDGEVEFLLEGELAWKSVWAVVDFQSGELALATPEGYPLEEMDPVLVKGLFGSPDGGIRPDAGQPESLEVLVVEPNIGAWSLVYEGGRPVARSNLLEGSPEETEVEMTQSLDGRVPQPSPRGNIVVAIDPHTMETFSLGPAE
jgi:hypothetical protein